MEIRTNINTNKGIIKLDLYGGKTPVTVASFVNLAQKGYYDGLTFHRVINLDLPLGNKDGLFLF